MSDHILYAALDEIRAHLGAAKMQRAPSDDKIIAEHIDAAHKIAVLTLREHGAGLTSANRKQVEGVAWDIIREAINTYDGFNEGEDYEWRELLEKIMGRMMERYSLYAQPPPHDPPIHQRTG